MHRLRVFDVVVQLTHQLHADGNGVMMIAYFDIAAKDACAELCLALLSANFLMHVTGAPLMFAINPSTGQIVATGRVPLQGLSAEKLAHRLETFVKSAKDLRAELSNPTLPKNLDEALGNAKGAGMRRQLMARFESYSKKTEAD